MKKAIKSITILVLLVIINPSFANPFTGEDSSNSDKKEFKMSVTNIHGSAKAYIKDVNGQVLLEKKVKGNGSLDVSFEISSLKDGSYFFQIEDDMKKQIIPFSLTEEEIKIDNEHVEKIYFPQLVEMDRSVIVKLLADESNDLYIDIKSKNGQLLLADKLNGRLGLIGKKFKFEPGEYKVTMTSNDFTQTKYLTID